MFSPDLMRYIIDNKGCPKSDSSKVFIKNSNKDYDDNLKNDIKNIKFNTNLGIRAYRKLLKGFQKNNNFEREKVTKI